MVELIPKRQPKPIFGQLFFVIISFAVLVGVGATYFALRQLIEAKSLERDRLNKVFIEDTRPEEEELSAALKQYRQQTDMLAAALNERSYYAPFFDLLETTTHPDVFFSTLQGDAKTGIFRLNGEATNFFVLEQQRLAWQGSNAFTANLESIQLGADGTSAFAVEFKISPEFLKPK